MASEIDLELISQRILHLAELAVIEHLEAVSRSQADGLLALMQQEETAAEVEH